MTRAQGFVCDSQPGSHDLDNESDELLSGDRIVLLSVRKAASRQAPHARRPSARTSALRGFCEYTAISPTIVPGPNERSRTDPPPAKRQRDRNPAPFDENIASPGRHEETWLPHVDVAHLQAGRQRVERMRGEMRREHRMETFPPDG